jgi:hypothetical protein
MKTPSPPVPASIAALPAGFFLTRRLLTAGFLLLVLLPMLGLWRITDQREQKQRRLALERGREDLTRVLGHYRKLALPEVRLQKIVSRLFQTLMTSGIPPTARGHLLKRGMELFLFDRQGKRLTAPGFSNTLIRSSENFLKFVIKSRSDEPFKPEKSEARQAESFFDTSFAIEHLAQNPHKMMDMAAVGSQKFGGYFEFPENPAKVGYLLVRMNAACIEAKRLVPLAQRNMQRLAGGQFAFAWQGRNGETGGAAEVFAGVPPGALQEIGASGSSRIREWNGALLASTLLDEGTTLWVRTTRSATPGAVAHGWQRARNRQDGEAFFGPVAHGWQRARNRQDGEAFFGPVDGSRALAPEAGLSGEKKAILAGGVMLVVFLLLFQFTGKGLSFPLKLALIFGMAGGGGLLTLWSFAQAYLENHQEMLLQEAQLRATNILQKADTQFKRALDAYTPHYLQFCREFERRLNKPDQVRADQPLPSVKKVWDTLNFGLINFAALIEQDGSVWLKRGKKLSFKNSSPWLAIEEKDISLGAQIILLQFRPEISAEQRKAAQQDLFPRLGFMASFLVGELGSRINMVSPFVFEGRRSIEFVGLLYRPDRLLWGMFAVSLDFQKLESLFLQRFHAKIVRENRLFYALPKNEKLTPFPTIETYEEDLLKLNEEITQSSISAGRIGVFKNRPRLLFGLPGTFLTDYNLFLITDFAPIQQNIRRLERRFLLLSLLVVGFAVFLSLALGQAILRPLRELTEGAQRLADSRLDTSLALDTGDELTTISEGINVIMEDRRDLAVAQTLQEQLFPDESLMVGAVTARGWSRTSSAFGGELYDYLDLGKGRLAFCIAGIPRRTISAALGMAMTKLGLRLLVQLGIHEPEQVFAGFWQYFGQNLVQRQNLELCYGVIDPTAGSLTLTGFGRVVVVCRFPDGTCRTLNEPGEPRNAPAPENRSAWTYSLELPPGSRILAFSAGIGTTRDPAGQPFGLEGLTRLAAESGHLPPVEIGPRLFALLDDWSGTPVPAAGQTLVCVQG